MYKIIQKIQIVETKIESCVECKYFQPLVSRNNFTQNCLKSNKILPYIYKFPIPQDCPLP